MEYLQTFLYRYITTNGLLIRKYKHVPALSPFAVDSHYNIQILLRPSLVRKHV